MNSDVVEARGRLGTALATQYDADGKELKFDIREDDLQNEKLQETVELLVAAGYFRARIKGLSPFDKVVGGMVWCISFCDFDVDVDLLYQENLSIGQKISLTEKIVRVLPKMKCPVAIEPHQIQGLDFIHIFPVVQWLVRKALEAKEEMGDAVQVFAASQFDQTFLKEDAELQNRRGKVLSMHDHMKDLSTPQRLYRRNNLNELTEEASKVQSTILEYTGSGATIKSDKKKSSTSDASAAIAEKDPTDILMSGMSKIDASKLTLTASSIASQLDTENLQQLSKEYVYDISSLQKLSVVKNQESVNDQTSIDELKAKKTELLEIKAELQKEIKELKEQFLERKNIYLEQQALEQQIKEEFELIRAAEASAEEKEGDLLKTLLSQRDETKKIEQDFKERCKKEAALLQSEIDRLSQRQNVRDVADEELERLRNEHSIVKKEFDEKRLDLAAANREIGVLQRKLDDVPSRAELNQYQRRFMELYNQIASTHKETKKFYTLFNTLQDVKTYIEKEIGLLNSVYDNYETAMLSEASKLQLVRQLEQTLEGIRQTRTRVEKKCTEEKIRRDTTRETYQEMLDKQRLYYKTVKDFQEECQRNEMLHARLRELEGE